MIHASRKTLLLGIIIALSSMITGCFLRGQAVFNFQNEDGTSRSTYSTVVPNGSCDRDGVDIISCSYFSEEELNFVDTTIVLRGPGRLLLELATPWLYSSRTA